MKRVHRVEDIPVEQPLPVDDSDEPVLEVEPTLQKPEKKLSKKRKRRANEEEEKVEDLESRYMNKIYSKVAKPEPVEDAPEEVPEDRPEEILEEAPDKSLLLEIDDELLQHETLTPTSSAAEKTIFISNLPVKVLTSKPLLRSLKQLFSTHGQIASIRFRSIAFSELVPRKVAYITKNFHPERDTLNAYIVYAKEESVPEAVVALNGYLWEGKHLRVDSVSNPSVSSLFLPECLFF